MTQEEARKAAEVMMAYADGKEIEIFHSGEWKITQYPAFNWGECPYRIKPEPTYRPFANKEECWNEMKKHQPFGWIKKDTFNMFITLIDEGICRTDKVIRGYEGAFQDFIFADGTPFGIKEE